MFSPTPISTRPAAIALTGSLPRAFTARDLPDPPHTTQVDFPDPVSLKLSSVTVILTNWNGMVAVGCDRQPVRLRLVHAS